MSDTLTPQLLEYITRLAAAAFTEKEISIALEIKIALIKLWMNDEDSDFFKAVMKGKLETQLKLRERIIKDAGNGSSPAQTLAIKIIEDSALKSKMK